jgi:hypothetical protein
VLTSQSKNPDDGGRGGMPAVILSAVVVACLLGMFTAFILHHYFLKPYSDPLHGVNYAQNLAREFATSRWPAGYAIYLWVFLNLAGKYGVFLANLPVLLGVALLTGMLARTCASSTESKLTSLLMGVGTIALLLRFDLFQMVYLTNPYRDPLSYVFMLLSAWLFVAYLRGGGRRLPALCTSGVLLGLAAFIKEPAVFLAAPLFLLGIVYRRVDSRIVFWKSCVLFGIFLFIGLLPSIVQTYASTDQLLMPQYVVRDSQQYGSAIRIPGMGFGHFGETMRYAGYYYWDHAGPFYSAGLLLGILYAIIRKNRFYLGLVIPTAALYALFYGCYRLFGARYFFVVTVFTMPIIAFGLFGTLHLLTQLVLPKRFTPAVLSVSAALLAGWALWGLRPVGPSIGEFKISHARGLTTQIEEFVPAGSTVYCHRHLNEILSWFSSREACDPACHLVPVREFESRPFFVSDEGIRNGINARLNAGSAQYFLQAPYDKSANLGRDLLLRYFDLVPVASFPTDQYGLTALQGDGNLVLYRIQAWTNSETRIELPAASIANPVLCVDAGTHNIAGDTVVELFADGIRIDDSVSDGMNYYPLDGAAPHSLLLKRSDSGPMPGSVFAEFCGPNDSLFLDFGILARHCSDNLLSEAVLSRPVFDLGVRSFVGVAEITLPVLSDGPTLVFGKIMMKSAPHWGEGNVSVSLVDAATEQCLATYSVPRDWAHHEFPFRFASAASRSGHDVIRLVSGSDQTGASGSTVALRDPDLIQIDGIHLMRMGLKESFELDVGTMIDDLFLVSGYHDREKADGTVPVRWSTGHSEMTVYVLVGSRDLQLTVTHWQKYRPENAAPVNPKLSFNGIELTATETPVGGTDGLSAIVAIVPAELVTDTSNRVELLVGTWKPGELSGSADTRDLGVMIDRIRLSPVADR